jgi:hypothetical protein
LVISSSLILSRTVKADELRFELRENRFSARKSEQWVGYKFYSQPERWRRERFQGQRR